jgi:hypothetical protein
MTSKLFSLMAGAALLALAGTAQAGQPMPLSDNQMDNVTAGGIGIGNAVALAIGAVDAVTVTQTSTNVVTTSFATSFAIGQSYAQALAASTLTQAAAIAHADSAASLP